MHTSAHGSNVTMHTPSNMFGYTEQNLPIVTFPGPDTRNLSYMKNGSSIRTLGFASL